MKTVVAPKKVLEILNSYTNLNIRPGCSVTTPYYIRKKTDTHKTLQGLSGKGSPEEIIMETLIAARLRNVDLQQMSPVECRRFMIQEHIGIDCSGLVSNLVDKWLRVEYQSSIRKALKPFDSLRQRLAFYVRPIMNSSVALLTDKRNSIRINDVKNIHVGDFIRMSALTKGDHIVIVIKEEFNKAGLPIKIFYAQSSQRYGDNNGVRVELIEIVDFSKPLEEQKWKTLDGSENQTLSQYKKDLNYSGIFRLNIFNSK